MSLPFSLVGNFIYIFYVVIVVLIIVLPMSRWLLNDKRWKWWVIIPVILPVLITPIVEELWIAHQFENLCQDAGVYVTRRVKAQGFYDSVNRSFSTKNKIIDNSDKVKVITDLGFAFSENKTIQGKVRHWEIKNNKIIQTIIDKPTALYHYIQPHQDTKISHRIYKWEWRIMDSKSKEMIAKDTHFHRYPGWIETLWIKFIGTGQEICKGSAPLYFEERHLLYRYVFEKNK